MTDDHDALNARFGVTDDQLDADAAPFEDGSWDGHLDKPVMGRPRLFDEELRTVSLRVPASTVKALDDLAASQHETRSALLRRVINATLNST